MLYEFKILHYWYIRKTKKVRKEINSEPKGTFIAEEKGKVIGFINSTTDKYSKIGLIFNISVAPEMQGHGVGKKLLLASLKYFRKKKMKFAKLDTLEGNKKGRKFYPQMGFKEACKQIHYIKKI